MKNPHQYSHILKAIADDINTELQCRIANTGRSEGFGWGPAHPDDFFDSLSCTSTLEYRIKPREYTDSELLDFLQSKTYIESIDKRGVSVNPGRP